MTSPFLAADPAAPTWYDIVDSPVGRILLTGDERALGGLYLLDAGEHSASVRPEWTRRPGGFAAVADQLAEYFAGSRRFDVPLAPRGTPFQLAVWAELTRSPTARRPATARSRPRSANHQSPRAPSGSPTGATPSRSSSRAIA